MCKCWVETPLYPPKGGGQCFVCVCVRPSTPAPCRCVQIELTRGYGNGEFREDIKKLMILAGVERKATTFLFTDSQIVKESFLEDINGVLNSGEVPNLFANDEKDKIVNDCREHAAKMVRVFPCAPSPVDILFCGSLVRSLVGRNVFCSRRSKNY